MTRNNAWHIARNNMETIGDPINTTSFRTWGLSCPKEEYDRTLGTRLQSAIRPETYLTL